MHLGVARSSELKKLKVTFHFILMVVIRENQSNVCELSVCSLLHPSIHPSIHQHVLTNCQVDTYVQCLKIGTDVDEGDSV